MLKFVSVPGMGLSGEHVDRRLVRLVQMRLGAHARRDRQKVHADTLGADRLGGDACEIAEPLLAVIGMIGANDVAGGL